MSQRPEGHVFWVRKTGDDGEVLGLQKLEERTLLLKSRCDGYMLRPA